MKPLLQALIAALVLLVTCQARAASSDDSDLDQATSFHSAEYLNNNGNEGAKIAKAIQEARLLRLREDVLAFRNWLTQVSHSTDEMEKRFKPSGFLGSRGKRFIPGLESLLLARYYQGWDSQPDAQPSVVIFYDMSAAPISFTDAEKWKRQPHLGFHGSRG